MERLFRCLFGELESRSVEDDRKLLSALEFDDFFLVVLISVGNSDLQEKKTRKLYIVAY